MSDLIEDAQPGMNAPEFSVSEISGAVKRVIEGEFAHVRVRGEIGRISRPRSGHVYLDLKDDRAVLAAVIWKGVAARMKVAPEEGMEVVATGRLTTFAGQSRYQLVIEEIAPAGMGALMAMLEKRRKALEAEGLFAPSAKTPLPYLPEVIGVVTSPSGAVIRDILHRLRDRFPRRVLIWPVAVQGERCAPEVANAIRGLNALAPDGPVPRPDLIIVARGGGSIEDLWGFNEEAVVRAAFESAIPLISAVGHETDTTLIDHAADRRAPTPTAAAELAVPVRAELLAALAGLEERRRRALARGLELRGRGLRDLARALPRPVELVEAPAQRLDYAAGRLPAALRGLVQGKQIALGRVAARLRPSDRVAQQARRLDRLAGRLPAALRLVTSQRRGRLDAAAAGLRPGLLARSARDRAVRLDALARRFGRATAAQAAGWRTRLDALERLRQTLGYKETLRRGYAVVRSGARVLTTRAEAEGAGALEIEFRDGRLAIGGAARARRDGGQEPPGQGSLF
ncbi:exodeoxyribonuclease VII large subunit [Maritimibacter sp. 55A14]|uniref:exodeoxyribonuclease VII large subunit n=1 Tax=Maritimibacter sp. 55A14 TaxID=2174844 RepID=UPI000D604EFD|nr:exodeoxyribonuclease VII large subunit [Maritimibacter sp. 55A14]PWE32056.1 exodeoxyribonuclease VII large subunit [Maritimibacter sp. 55A14]